MWCSLLKLFSIVALRRDERGNVLMLTAFALPCIIAAAGLGVHTMQLSLNKRQLQRQADSAAMAGAYSLYQGRSTSVAVQSANKALAQNDLVRDMVPTITPGPYTSNAGLSFASTMHVRVVGTIPTPFMAFFGNNTSTVAAEARAAVVPADKFCFLALEDQSATGIRFQGNTRIDLGCGVGTNAKGSSAVIASGSSWVRASPIAAMGEVPPSANYEAGTALRSNHSEINDPFAGNDYEPSSSEVSNGSCKRNASQWKLIDVPTGVTKTSAQLIAETGVGGPGCYGTVSVNGTLILASGVYYLADGANNAGLQIGAQGRLECQGCTFVLTSTTPDNGNSHATMNIHGGATLDISPPAEGKYEGVTVYRDRRASRSNQCCTINGNSASNLSGAFYFPRDYLTFNGTTGMTVSCFQMIARRLHFTGDSEITNSCIPPGGEDRWKLSNVRLIS